MYAKNGGVVIKCSVKTNCDAFRIRRGDDFYIEVRSTPQKGRANTEIIKHLTKIFRRDAEIVGGFSNKDKFILIHGIIEDEVKRIAQSLEQMP